jgi:hypothetical protein
VDLVPEEAIEALARGWFEAESATRFAKPLPWDSVLLAKARERQREWARAALEAAAPLILAAGFERLADEIAAEQGSSRFGGGSFGSGIQRAALLAHRAASVLRGEGDPK